MEQQIASGSGGDEIFHNPVYQPQPVVSIPPCSSKYYKYKKHKCNYCDYQSDHKHVLKRHMKAKHEQKAGKVIQSSQPIIIGGDGGSGVNDDDNGNGGGGGGSGSSEIDYEDDDDDDDDDETPRQQFNVQLEPEFKIYIAGPSKSGKTYFCSQLLANLSTIAKSKPATTIYVYASWQTKLKEMKQQGLVDVFLKGGPDLEERLKRVRIKSPTPTLIIFDDLMMDKENLPYISKLFAIGRHSKLSLIFITQRIFVDDNSIRVIRENSDYYVLMKNPTNAQSVSQLTRRLNPNPSLVSNIFLKATHNKPYSYLFCNVTQQASQQTQFLSELFERDHIAVSYVIDMNNMANLRKSTTFHKMYLVSAEKMEKVTANSGDDRGGVGGMGCSKPEEEKEEEEVTPLSPPLPQPELSTPAVEEVSAAAAATPPELLQPLPPPLPPTPTPAASTAAVMDLDKQNLKRKRDIGAGEDDDGTIQPPQPTVPAAAPEPAPAPTTLPTEQEVGMVVEEEEEEEEEENPFIIKKCTQCDQSFKNSRGLKIHTTRMHPLSSGLGVQMKKNKGWKLRSHLPSEETVHQLKIKKSTENRHNGHCYCKICLQEFTSRQAYNRHVDEKHLKGWKVHLPKVNVNVDDDDDDDDGRLSDMDNPMEDEEEMSVEKRLKSNKKKAKLNRKILKKHATVKLRQQQQPYNDDDDNDDDDSDDSDSEDEVRAFATKNNKEKVAAAVAAAKKVSSGVVCQRCGKRFLTDGDLKAHLMAVHQQQQQRKFT